MGVYIVLSRHAAWFKLGHHKVGPKRPNVYYRYINRGFGSCVHPREIRGRVGFDDVELSRWYPSLNMRDERALHRRFAHLEHVGEWYRVNDFSQVIDAIEKECGAKCEMPGDAELNAARVWAARLGRR